MRQIASPEVEHVELGPGKHSSAAASSLDSESPQWGHTSGGTPVVAHSASADFHADVTKMIYSKYQSIFRCAVVVALPQKISSLALSAVRGGPRPIWPKTGSFWCRRLGIKSSWAQKAELDSAERLIQGECRWYYDSGTKKLRCDIRHIYALWLLMILQASGMFSMA